MAEITRQDYEAGRVRRRDGGEFRIAEYGTALPTAILGSGEIIGWIRDGNEQWEGAVWNKDGDAMWPQHRTYDLILAPRTRTVYVNIYSGSDLAGVYDDPRQAKEDAANTVNKCLARAVPIEIQD